MCSARVRRSRGLWNIYRKLRSWLKACCSFPPRSKKFLSFLNPKQNSLNRSRLASNIARGVTFPRIEDIISKSIMPCHLLGHFTIDRHQPREIVLLLPPGRHQPAPSAGAPTCRACRAHCWPWGRQTPSSVQRCGKGSTEGSSCG